MTQRLDSYKIVSDSLVAVTQRLNQTVSSTQAITVDCTHTPEGCFECMNFYAQEGVQELESINERCRFTCACDVNNVDLEQQVHVDFSSIQTSTFQGDFVAALMDNILLEAYENGIRLDGFDTNSEAKERIAEIGAQISETLSSDTMQESLQALAVDQIVQLKGPPIYVNGITMRQMVNMVSSVMQSNTETVELINALDNELRVFYEETVLTATETLIIVIIMALAVVIVIVATALAANWLIQLITG